MGITAEKSHFRHLQGADFQLYSPPKPVAGISVLG